MAQKELEIEISPDGQVKINPKGIKGQECHHWADLLAQIVGREESRRMTAEFYETGVQTQQHQDVKQRR